MQIYSIADIAGGAATVPIGTAPQQARALFLTALGTSGVRFGDPSVTASQGVLLPVGAQVVIRASEADKFDHIQLGQASAYIPSGATLTIAFGI